MQSVEEKDVNIFIRYVQKLGQKHQTFMYIVKKFEEKINNSEKGSCIVLFREGRRSLLSVSAPWDTIRQDWDRSRSVTASNVSARYRRGN